LRAGLEVNSQFADLHYFLGNIQLHLTESDEALASYRSALTIQPDHAGVLGNMAPAMLNLCDFQGAAAAARKALALNPQMHHARSNLLLALSGDANCSAEQYLAEARMYGQVLMAQTGPRRNAQVWTTYPSDASASSRLCVGFVSGDLRNHPVGYFLENVLAHWDDVEMQTVAYSNHPSHDDLTVRLKERFGAWRDISGTKDEAAAKLIQSDRVDVLIDLSGHTADNRLPLFALRPTQVQVTWLGYWASTGLPAIDYLLADAISLPPDQRGQFTESIWYLPDTRFCFAPPSEAGFLEMSSPPAQRTGYVTFGSFQRLTKLNDDVLCLWARVLHAVPSSRLRLQSVQMKDGRARSQLLKRLVTAGIDAARVRLVEAGTRMEYLAAHSEVDILLDTFPHSGATTTCEALWMGVPTITLAGTTMLARQGVSLLCCAGLSDWVSSDAEDYVARAVRHANDLQSLARLRSGLREQVAASPLFDAARFTRALQTAVRSMWQQKVFGSSAERSAPLNSNAITPPLGFP
jgi:protein O-GlcNAc transferase